MRLVPSLMAAAFLVLAMAGCDTQKPPPPHELGLTSPYNGVRTLAVAPTLNLSGSREFDSYAVSDQIFAELQQVSGFNVLPVNKTLAAMQHLGLGTINSAQSAQMVADALGADGIVIPVITLYDPYRPPVVGMTMQLYSGKSVSLSGEPEARQVNGATLPVVEGGVVGVSGNSSNPNQPVAQVEAVFDAHNQTVLAELREFARGRTNYESALQEDRFLADIDSYTRFVAHAMVRRLIEVERARVAGR